VVAQAPLKIVIYCIFKEDEFKYFANSLEKKEKSLRQKEE